MSLIRPGDIPYEQQLIKDPYNIDVWLEYYEAKLSQPEHTVESLVYILSRALRYLNRSYKIWMIYLNLRIDNAQSVEGVISSFESARHDIGKFPNFWLLYLNYIKTYENTSFVNLKFNQCLKMLPIPHHFKVWPIYLEFAEKNADFAIFKRYFRFKLAFSALDKSDYEQLLDKLVEYSGEPNSKDLIQVFETFINDKMILATVDNEFDIYWKYTEVLMKYKLQQVDDLVQKAIEKFPDQKYKLTLRWAKYYVAQQDGARAREIYEKGITESTTIRDFIAIYEAYLEFEENVISELMDTEGEELEMRMANFENLLNKREFYINDIYLKQDPDNVDTWLKRVGLYDQKTQLKDILETYVQAIMTINPKKVQKGLHRLWIGYISVYEKNGDLNTARSILSKCVNVPFNDIHDLEEVWFEWSNMELNHDDIDQAIKILEIPLTSKDVTVNYNDTSLPVQARIFKSFKIWSFYLDLVESSGDIDKTSQVYEKMIELKVAKPITIINYASFFEENQMLERSLSVYEKGLKIFKFPIAYEIWNIYLTKVLKFSKLVKISNERIRDLFDQCLSSCTMTDIHAIILLYADFEESNKNLTKMFKIYTENVSRLSNESRVIVYKAYISKANEYLDLPSLRPIYESIINDEGLQISQDLLNFVKDFVSLESRLSDLNRARFVLRNFYETLNQAQKVVLLTDLQTFWKQFELHNGDEESFKEMLRFRRICEVKYGKLENKVMEGFVKSSKGPKVSSIDASKPTETNPDAIEVEFDSSDEDDDE